MIHKLKCYPQYFEAIVKGTKTFECRKDDRGFKEGDQILLQEYSSIIETYTGREFLVNITFILDSEEFGILPGYCVMAIKGR